MNEYEARRYDLNKPAFDLGDPLHYVGNLDIDRWGNLSCYNQYGRVWQIDKDKVAQLLIWLIDNHHVVDKQEGEQDE